MNSKLLNCLIAGALATTLALASPAFAFRGGGGGMHGGMHAMGGGGMHVMGGGMRFGGWHGGPHFGGGRFAAAPLAHAAFSPRFSGVAFHGRPAFFHHRFHRFAFVGVPFAYTAYTAYDSCWRRTWTPYGLRWINVCGDYGDY